VGARSSARAAKFGAVAVRKFKTGVAAHAAQNLSQVRNSSVAVARSPKVAGSCSSAVAAKLAPTTKFQADHAAFGDIALSLVFGPRFG